MVDLKDNPYRKGQSATPAGKFLPGTGKKVVVAMSGGVDSSVAAVLLREQGYEVIGIALQTTDYSKYRNDDTGGTCCSIKDMEDARRVAEKIGIPFYVLNTEKTFDSNVVDYFVNDYMQGRTPNPCVMCNSKVKFNHLYKKALDMGADFIATGHYAKTSHEPDLGHALWRSRDEAKDQTYFLFNLTPRQLERTLFPVGNLTKPEVRKIAEEFGLPVAEKPDSQEICFVPGNDYSKFIMGRTALTQRRRGHIVGPGNVVLGEHEGIFSYTIGQRKGLGDALDRALQMGLADADKFYVVRLDAEKAQVVLGPESELLNWGLMINNVNWISPPELLKTRVLQVKIRSRAEPVNAELRLMGDARVEVRFFEAQRAVTPGQACVIYDGNLCLGGGWIAQALQIPEVYRPRLQEESVSS